VIFRSQFARDVACLLDIDDAVAEWRCQSLPFRNGAAIYRPDFVAKIDQDTVVIDAVTEDTPLWMADAVREGGYKYEAVRRPGLPAIRLKNAKDLLRYGKFQTGLEDRVRLLAALVEQISLGKGANNQAGAAYFEMPIIAHRGRANYDNQIAMTLAGLAAEELVFEETYDGAGVGSSSDLARATRLATMMETSLGMGASYRHCAATDDDALEILRRSDAKLRGRIDAKLAQEFARAKGILESERPALIALAKELFKSGALEPEKVREIMDAIGQNKKAAA